MTYADALDWCIKNLPMNEYDNYQEWYKVCEEKLATPNLFESAEFNDSMEDAWLDAFGTYDKEPIPEPESKGIRVVGQTILYPKDVPAKISSKTPITIQKLPETERRLPPTGKAPRIQPEIILPPIKKKGITERIRNVVYMASDVIRFIRRKK